LGDIGAAIQSYVEPYGFSIVREWTGHGIGRERHEADPAVFHHGRANTGALMRPGMVFTIEPMVNEGDYRTKMLSDGWTVVTADGKRSAQFEHTLAITETGVEVLSLP
jgi:methionyl aminopeptidase